MTNSVTAQHNLTDGVRRLGLALETKCPEHDLVRFLGLFRGGNYDSQLIQEYQQRFGNGIGSTMMEADLNYCRALEAALRE
jgi:hypothetical protein